MSRTVLSRKVRHRLWMIRHRIRHNQFVKGLLPHEHDWARCDDKFWLDECEICAKTRIHRHGTPTRAQKAR